MSADHVHDWQHEPARLTLSGRIYGPYRVCECGVGHQLEMNPPPDHPDSATADLSPAEEDIVDALDTQFAEVA